MKLDSNDKLIQNHINHLEPCEQRLSRQNMLSNKLKRKAVDDIACRPTKLVHMETINQDIPTLDTDDLKLIKRNI